MVKLPALLGCLGLTLIPAAWHCLVLQVVSASAIVPCHCLEYQAVPGPLVNPKSKIQDPKRMRSTETVALRRWDQASRVGPSCLGFVLQGPQPLLRRLKPADRARVLAALAGLIILGFALVLLAWWGARFTRRYLKRPWPGSEHHKAGGVSEFDWASKPLYDDENSDRREEEKPRE